jgi:prophage tail gpP-like protein
MAEQQIELRFDGVRYTGWQRVDIRESVDDLCSQVQLASAGPGIGDELPMTANTVVEVLVEGELATTVRVDMVRRHVGSGSHTISLQGRSLGRELVDCQYSKTMGGLKLGEIVMRLGKTFEVPVKIDAETAVVPDFSMQCEQPANALINAARTANLLIYPTPDGGIVLTAPTSAAPVATVRYGEHIKAYDVVDEYKLRFSDYVVKSFDYASSEALKGAVKDSGISYFRPMHIVADRHGGSAGACGRRAELERNRRQARAHRIELEVVGWRHAAGLWAINTQVRVVIPREGIDGVYLVGERAFTFDAQGGSVTHLQVMSRDAFVGNAVPSRKKRNAGSRK